MHAVVPRLDGTLAWQEVPEPRLGPGEVRIRVAAAGVNRADLMQRAGTYPPPPGASDILGLECSGTIDEVGEGVTGWSVGQPVCALLAGGGYAERVVCHASHVLPVPAGCSVEDAGALPEVFCTAWSVLCAEAGLRRGERVLIHAGGSGVGTAAIQLATVLGAYSFATAGGAEKLARCTALGASGTADRHAGPWTEAVRAWAPDGVDVVLDPVGAGYLPANQRVLGVGGRIVVIGLLAGRHAELDLGRLLVKRQRVIGTVLRSRSVAERAGIVSGVLRDVWPHVASGAVGAVIDRVVPVAEVEEAHRALQANDTVGKVLLRMPS